MKKKIIILSSLLTSLVAIYFIAVSCSSESIYDEPDTVTADSPELEDYIIAATDLDQALKLFEQELNKIDFSKLETVIEDGREVTYMPEMIQAIDIDDKLMSMNETRLALVGKHPQFISSSEEKSMQYFQHSIRTSAKITNHFFEFGYDFNRPMIKTRSENTFGPGGENESALMWYLYNWCNQPASSFVELSIIFYTNGNVYVSSTGNTNGQANFALASKNGKWYYPNSSSPQNEVSGISHTHTYGGPAPTDPEDYTLKNTYPGITHSIYHGGALRKY